jgi:hypothetical protein
MMNRQGTRTAKLLVTAMAALACLAGMASPSAHAEPVRFHFNGRVTEATVWLDGSTVPVGTKVSGSFSYDTSAEGSWWSDGQTFEIGDYNFDAPYAMTFQFAGHAAKIASPAVSVKNGLGSSANDMLQVYTPDQGVKIDGTFYAEKRMGMVMTANAMVGDWLTSVQPPSALQASQLNRDNSFGYIYNGGADDRLLLVFSIDKIFSRHCVVLSSKRLICD